MVGFGKEIGREIFRGIVFYWGGASAEDKGILSLVHTRGESREAGAASRRNRSSRQWTLS